MKRLRPEGTIKDYLDDMYPGHQRLKLCVDLLNADGYVQLKDLATVSSNELDSSSSALFRAALHPYIAGGARVVNQDETFEGTVPNYISSEVELRQDGVIPELPEAHNPMSDKDVRAIEDEDEEDDQPCFHFFNAVVNNPEEQQQPPLRCEPLKATMYTFDQGGAFLRSLWGKCSSPKLLVRHHYKELFVKLQNMWASGSRAVMLTGTPGIGKTGFLIYLLVSLMERYRPVVLRTKGGEEYLFQPPSVPRQTEISTGIPAGYVCYSLVPGSGILMDEEVYFLADGKLKDPPTFSGRALLASTPSKANSKDYKKDGRYSSLVLPCWTAAEIALVYQEIYAPDLPAAQPTVDIGNLGHARANLTLDVVRKRYSMWGGNPRYVLEKPDVKDLQSIVHTLKSIRTTVEAVGKDGDHPAHKIVHMKVMPGYEEHEYMFASPYALRLAKKKLKEETGTNACKK